MTEQEILAFGIKVRAEEHKKEIDARMAKIKSLQEICPHINTKKKHWSSDRCYPETGTDYYTDFECPDCGKRWTEEGSL